ncbi:hypothetical protein J6590_017737 [Homalodisca vitripennis]|nr:hypothetical protein J6590_017737 [Homalodisca vitripennis]
MLTDCKYVGVCSNAGQGRKQEVVRSCRRFYARLYFTVYSKSLSWCVAVMQVKGESRSLEVLVVYFVYKKSQVAKQEVGEVTRRRFYARLVLHSLRKNKSLHWQTSMLTDCKYVAVMQVTAVSDLDNQDLQGLNDNFLPKRQDRHLGLEKFKGQRTF